MDFNVEIKALETDALSLDYFVVPWDSELLGREVAGIRNIKVRNPESALIEFRVVSEWKLDADIAFSTAKIAHSQVAEARLIQSVGYQFIELNYKPEIDLQLARLVAPTEFEFADALPSDRNILCEFASKIFRNTRFHLDPLLGQAIGDRRYETWMRNAFELDSQRVVKCMRGDEIMAFFVQEYPQHDHVFWSLVGLAPGLTGKGLAKKIWPAALQWLRDCGVNKASTSISSLNTPVVNLYAGLGFNFPEPEMNFHWHRCTKDA